MAWPPDPDEVRKHEEQAHVQRRGQRYNTPPPPPPAEEKPKSKKDGKR